MAVAIEVQERGPRVPACAVEDRPLLPVASLNVPSPVAIENVMAVVGDEQVGVAVVVVVARADALSPAAGIKARLAGDVNERAVPLLRYRWLGGGSSIPGADACAPR